MASVSRIVLWSGTATGNITTEAVPLELLQTDFVVRSTISAFSGTSLVILVTTSLETTAFFTRLTVPTFTATGSDISQITAPMGAYARIQTTFTGTGSYTGEVVLLFDTRR